MYYFQFKRTNLGNLILISRCNNNNGINFNNGCVWYSEEEIENVKDNFLLSKQRVVKTGKTWLKNYTNKKTLK